jgi:hypothetical protein
LAISNKLYIGTYEMKKKRIVYDWDKVLELIKQGLRNGVISHKLNIPVDRVSSWKYNNRELWEPYLKEKERLALLRHIEEWKDK